VLTVLDSLDEHERGIMPVQNAAPAISKALPEPGEYSYLGVYRNRHTLGKRGMPVKIAVAMVSGYLRTSLSLDIFSLLLTVTTTSSISGGISLQHKVYRTAKSASY